MNMINIIFFQSICILDINQETQRGNYFLNNFKLK